MSVLLQNADGCRCCWLTSHGMARGDVQQTDVLAAIAEYDDLGQEGFLERYKMGKAMSYVLRYGGKDYDSKAIFAAAHGHHPGLDPLSSDQFSGGADDAAKYLRRLGFHVYSSRGPTWTRDELILACDLVYRNDWKGLDDQDDRVRELSALLQELPIHPPETRGPKFRNTNGVSRKTYDLATRHPNYTGAPTRGGAGDLVVLQEFIDRGPEMAEVAKAIRDGVYSGRILDAIEAVPDVDEFEEEASEGRLLQRVHFARERDRTLRAKKIEQHRAISDNLECELCGFDFEAAYGEHGEGYIECHHVVPLHASGVTTTRLTDLILICANCHRMIHRRNPWLTPTEVMDLVSEQYDTMQARIETPGVKLRWHRVRAPDGYDTAYETAYAVQIRFRAIRSASVGHDWRLERSDPEVEYDFGGISHESSLRACKQRIEHGIATGAYFALIGHGN